LRHRVFLAAAKHMDPVAFFPGIRDVQNVAGLGLKPLHLVTAPETVDQPEPRRLVPMEAHDTPVVVLENVDIVVKRQIVQDGIVFGQAHIMRGSGALEVDI
jgi:hypothetical protein